MTRRTFLALVLALFLGAGAVAAQEPTLGEGRTVAYYTVEGMRVKEFIPFGRKDILCVHTWSGGGASLSCMALTPPSSRADNDRRKGR